MLQRYIINGERCAFRRIFPVKKNSFWKKLYASQFCLFPSNKFLYKRRTGNAWFPVRLLYRLRESNPYTMRERHVS